ncbi:hypothetical protein AB0442_11530 [Kitasatospora sp. NPDC085895]|uniref:hypothetical protein n=1 Tax=Kitasatospora sp. NPDC085895 TaxID=3155057 RepID=UPI00344E6D59
MQPNSDYTLTASVRGPYVFVGASGTGTETVATWSDQSDWNGLSVRVTTGADTTELTVSVHGWYGQGPYDVRWMSFTGPGVAPDPCGGSGTVPQTPSGGPASPSPSPGCMRTYLP